jgi:GT2 family glycosyltransferase
MSDWHCILNPEIDEPLLYREPPINPQKKNCIHLGGVYNSFYPYDWHKIAGSSSFQFLVKGALRNVGITIYLHTPNAAATMLGQLETNKCADQAELTIQNFNLVPGQRLTCQIESDSIIDLESIDWTALPVKTNHVKLGIVICTYNNEARLKENIEALVTSDVWHEQKPVLILANNGNIQDDSWLPQDRFVKFDQQNLGGSGGFGRGIYEVVYGQLQQQGITHILLMDDDVKFHPEVISRAIAFHKKSLQPVGIGGAMLKLEDPTWLHEAGGNIKTVDRVGVYTDVPVGRIQDTGALNFLGRAKEHDYNAWWFCSFPTDAVRKIGLPLPIFIHGDDVEYGKRLKANGFANYCPGGISLWHESFEDKRLSWIRYFDCRNALIRLSTNKENKRDEINAEVLRRLHRLIVKNDYGACAMIIEAYKDFCAGPNVLKANDFPTQINRLTQAYSAHTYDLTSKSYKKTIEASEMIKPNKWIRFIKRRTTNMSYLGGAARTLWKTSNTRYVWWNVPFYADILLTSNDSIFYLPRDPRVAKRLSNQLKVLTKQNDNRLNSIIDEWREDLHLFTKPDFWRVYCKPK